MNKKKIIITPLGGLGEFGKNIMLFEVSDEMLLIDCGVKLLKNDFFGLNGEIPDYRFLQNNKKKIKGLLVTHGHLDHIGGIPFLLNKIDIPIYASDFAASIIRGQLAEHGHRHPKINEIVAGKPFDVGAFHVEPIAVDHSIVQAFAFAITTPFGTVVHSGDFRCDAKPYLEMQTDFKKLEKIGKKGVLALLSDSTGAPTPGTNRSETEVFKNFNKLFTKHKQKRLIIATFSTQINRIQQILDLAKKHNRIVFFSGRSILKNMKIAQKDYYKKSYDAIIRPLKDIKNYEPHRVLILSTGTQGEPNSSLRRLADKKHQQIKLHPEDVIVFSSSVIPGNDIEIAELIDILVLNGNTVISGKEGGVHASGHGSADELAMFIKKIKPRFFFPVHGNHSNMLAHKKIALNNGLKDEDVFLMTNGQRMEIFNEKVRILERLRLRRTFINDVGIASVDETLLKSRKSMMSSGVFSVSIVSDRKKTEAVVKAIGIVDALETPEIEKEASRVVKEYLENESSERSEKKLRKSLGKRLTKCALDYGVNEPELIIHVHKN